jgi:TFIIF-interacting CTD phosphatase-like protein
VLDIDETLVYATESAKEMPLDSLDTKIRIKVNRYKGGVKAYLSFRPYLIEMLMELEPDFELILYTCGTKEYARAFNDAVHKLFFNKYASHYYSSVTSHNKHDFQFFDHILSL